jgi:UDP-glucose 4-epimerase
MKILVTGGAGFIGSHLVDALIERGYQVIVIDNLSTGKKENINKKAKFYKIDICSPKIVEIFKNEKPQICFHLAAQINIRKSVEDPIFDAKVNILGSLNIIQNFIGYRTSNIGHSKFIFASSIAVYGEPKKLPIDENHPLNPISSYGIAKLTIENYLKLYSARGLNFVILRFSNVYGPRQRSNGEGGVISIFIDRILKGKKPIIFGDGTQTRDFLYVKDAVKALILSMKANPGSVYNVGANEEMKIKEVLNKISTLLGKRVEPIFKPRSKGEILKSRVDYSKIKKELSWRPKYNLEKGIKETIKFLSNFTCKS